MTMSVVEFLLAGFTDTSGEPLSLGKVHTYEAGTTTPKDVYLDSTGATPAGNPVTLDAYGRTQIYADGSYKFVVKTAAGATLYTLDNLYFGTTLDFNGREATDLGDATAASSAATLGQVLYGGANYVSSVGGSANAITLTPSPAIAAYTAGLRYRFKAAATNTNTVTVAISGLTPVALRKDAEGALVCTEGDIVAGTVYDIICDGTYLILMGPAGPKIVDREGTVVTKNTSTAEETLYTETIKAGTLGAYRGLRITAFGDVKNTTGGAATIIFKIKLGGTTFWAMGTVNISATTVDKGMVIIEAWILARDSASLQGGYGRVTITNTINGSNIAGVPSTAFTVLVGGNVAVAEASAGDLTLAITAQLGTSSSSIQVQLYNVFVEQL